MFLIKAKLGGQSIPTSLPENVAMAVLNSIASIQRFIAAAQPQIGSSNIQPQIGPSSAQPQIGPSVKPKIGPSNVQPQIGPSNNSGRIPVLNMENISVNSDRSNASQVITPVISDYRPSSRNSINSAKSSVEEVPGWAVSPADKAKYDAIFKAWDLGNTGYMTVHFSIYF
jgi:hypothetical protein